MDNEGLYLCSMATVLSMRALKCTAHLLSLLCLLRFIINACNKCVTLVWVIINMEWQSHVIFWLISCPLFVASSLRWDKNINVSLRVLCSAHLLRFNVLFVAWHMYGQDVSLMLVCLDFSAQDLLFVLHFFLPFLFFPFLIHLFFSWHFVYLELFFLFWVFLHQLALFMGSLFELPSLFLCSYGRLFLSLVGLPLCFFLHCSSVWLAWVCR